MLSGKLAQNFKEGFRGGYAPAGMTPDSPRSISAETGQQNFYTNFLVGRTIPPVQHLVQQKHEQEDSSKGADDGRAGRQVEKH